MSKFKASFYNFIFGSFNNVTLIILGVIMVPYYLNFFSVATYGAWLASGNVIGLLGSMEGGLSFIITQKLAVSFGERDFSTFRTTSTSGLIFITTIAIIFIMLVLGIHSFLPKWVNCPPQEYSNLTRAILFAGIAGGFGLINSTLGSFSQVWQLTMVPNLIRNVSNIINVAFIILFLNYNFGVASIAIGAAIRELLVFVFLSIYTYKVWKSKKINSLLYSFHDFYRLVREIAIPFFGRLSQIILNRSHNFIIAVFISPDISAIYEFTSKVTIMSKQFISILTNGLFGSISLARAEKQLIEYLIDIKSTLTIFFLFAIIGLGFSYVFSFDVVRFWVGSQNYGGDLLLTFVVLYSLVAELFQYQNNLILAEGKFNFATLMQILNAVIYISLSLILIKVFNLGVLSIPLSFLIGGIVMLIISNRYTARKFTINTLKLSYTGFKLIFISLFLIIPFKLVLVRFDYLNPISVFMLAILFFALILVIILSANIYLRNLVFTKVIGLGKTHNGKNEYK
jgi:O-antigen/teichoic acid export membrane protein